MPNPPARAQAVETTEPSERSAAGARLGESLLRGEAEVVETRRARAARPWAYGLAGLLITSGLLVYHLAVLLAWIMPKAELTRVFQKDLLEGLEGHAYFKGTGNTQAWDMFAPNPTRINAFIQVFVVDQDGEVWDFEQDIWGDDRYPYLFYDRRGKINRRIDAKKHYQRIYAAWVCREWERRNGGVPAKKVRFVRLWTRVPEARDVIARGGWSAWDVTPNRTEQETITCKTVDNGQLSAELRGRYGLEVLPDEGRFRAVKAKTWWTEAEAARARADQRADKRAD